MSDDKSWKSQYINRSILSLLILAFVFHLQPKHIWAQFYRDLHLAHENLFFCQHHLGTILPSTLIYISISWCIYILKIYPYIKIFSCQIHIAIKPQTSFFDTSSWVYFSCGFHLQPLCTSGSIPPSKTSGQTAQLHQALPSAISSPGQDGGSLDAHHWSMPSVQWQHTAPRGQPQRHPQHVLRFPRCCQLPSWGHPAKCTDRQRHGVNFFATFTSWKG